MKFTLLLFVISGVMKLSLMTKKSIREMIRFRNAKYVIKTRDGRRGIRFVFSKGIMRTDGELNDFDAAMVWNDADTAFRVLTSGDKVGMQKAMADWELIIEGNKSLINWFTVFMGFATGTMKRD